MASLPKSIAKILDAAIAEARARNGGQSVVLIGVGGAQGCGKSYHCRALAEASNGRIAHLSLDDFYYTLEERENLGRFRHPLFATRGPPGTHDLRLAKEIVRDLSHASPDGRMALPRFDKKRDDRAPKEEWPMFEGRPEAILFEGWCMGAKKPIGQQSAPMNALEAHEDPDGRWRNAMLLELQRGYLQFFANWFDDFVFLQAPNFDIVWRWREQQERELLGRTLSNAETSALSRFIQHFERITRAMMEGDHGARWIVRLNEEREVIGAERKAE